MGDHEIFLRLFLVHQDEIRAFIGALVRDRHARDDVLQEVALTLWQTFDRFDANRSFGAWARGVAANKVLQQRDKAGRYAVPFSPAAIQSLLDAFDRTGAAASFRADALEQCLSRLPTSSRRLLALRYEQSLQLDQVARCVQSTLDAVHKALSRVRAQLKECIERRLAAEQARGADGRREPRP